MFTYLKNFVGLAQKIKKVEFKFGRPVRGGKEENPHR